ncbi:kinase-like domain-containing protein [Hyaloraphidium curvatum]|nr:kinase-like domain-containing protein [Hyaloraphidium curvatum]
MDTSGTSDAPLRTPIEHTDFLGFSEGEAAALRLAEYKLSKTLGKGAYGTVKLAQSLENGSFYAIKIVDAKVLKRKRKEKMVEAECGVLANIRHPNIISLREWFLHEERYYLVFELASGGELCERIESLGFLNESTVAMLIATIFNALAFLGDHNIVHRDIKVDNLCFLDPTPGAPLCLVDFGIARVIEDTSSDNLLNSVCGSLAYTAPEVLRKTGYSLGVDVWAAGCVAYVLLSGGKHPFLDPASTGGIADMCGKIVRGDVSFSSPAFSKVSPLAKEFLLWVLDPNPETRPTAHEVLNHPWIRSRCPADFLDYLMEVNEDAEWQGIRNRDRKAALERTASQASLADSYPPEITITADDTFSSPLRKPGDTLNRRGTLASLGRRPSVFRTGGVDILNAEGGRLSGTNPDLLQGDDDSDAVEAAKARSRMGKLKRHWADVLKVVSSLKVWEGVVRKGSGDLVENAMDRE